MVASSLIFAHPFWLWLLPVLALFAYGLWRLSLVVISRRVKAFYSADYLPKAIAAIDWKQKAIRFSLEAIIIGLLAVALARPLVGPKAEAGDREGADIVIALDVSKSMWAEDVAPNRLEAVKAELGQWIEGQKTDRVGLILFAGEAFVQAPLTYDYTALQFVLREASPNSISRKGSNIPKAIETAIKMMSAKDVASKVLVIISDGENLDGDAISAARNAHRTDGITIYTVGVGTAAGSKVPATDKAKLAANPGQKMSYVRNEYGLEVVSRLDSQTLRAIASVGGGSYFEFKPGESTFPNIRQKSIAALVEKTRRIETKDYDEWFQIPLAAAICLMVIAPLLVPRRRTEGPAGTGVAVVQPTTYKTPRNKSKAAAAVALLALTILAAHAQNSPIDEAEKLIEGGKIDEALTVMQTALAANPTDPYLNYNYGLVLYRANRLDEANTIFQSADALAVEDPSLRAKVLFQMGNIGYKTGAKLRERGPNNNPLGAVRAFEEALSCYKAQIDIQSTRAAKQNLQSTSEQLEKVLLAIGTERTKANTEKTLREALHAYERAAELRKENQPLVDKAKELLSKKLAEVSATLDQEADKAEAAQKQVDERNFKSLLSKREEITSKLQEAVGLAPDDKEMAAALKKQQEKMSDFLTRAARDQAAPAMATEQFFSSKNLKSLEGADEKLESAQMLNPDNAEAKKLGGEVKEKLVDAYLANGDLALGHLKKSMAAGEKEKEAAAGTKNPKTGQRADGQLSKGIEAYEAFSGALGRDAENDRAKKGLSEVGELLPGLYSAAGQSDLEKAKAQLGDNLPSPSQQSSEQGASEGGEKSGEGKGKSGEAAAKPKPAGASELRAASATLEKAVQNLGAAANLRPEDQKFKDDLAAAQDLMSNIRSELDKVQGAMAAAGKGGEAGEGQEGAPGEGEGGTGEGKGQGKAGPQTSSLQSMSQLRGKGGEAGGGQGGETKRYWEKFVRDW